MCYMPFAGGSVAVLRLLRLLRVLKLLKRIKQLQARRLAWLGLRPPAPNCGVRCAHRWVRATPHLHAPVSACVRASASVG